MTFHLPSIVAAAGAAEAAGGAEQFGVSVSQVVMQVISFTILAVVLYRWGIKPVLATMDERRAKITDGLRFADEMKAKLADAEKQHVEAVRNASREAQKIIDEARTTAKQVIERESQQATEKAQQIMTKAEEAIELDRRKMMAEAQGEIARLVALTAGRVLNKELSPDDRRRYADAAARELTEA